MLSIFPSDQLRATHGQAHRGIIWENSRAFVPEWHCRPLNVSDSANVTVWKHQSVNKTLLCGSKGFQHSSRRQGGVHVCVYGGGGGYNGSAFLYWVLHEGLQRDWQGKIITITLESQKIEWRKCSSCQGIIKVISSTGYHCSLALSKLIVPVIFKGEALRTKQVQKGPLLHQDRSNTVIL